MSELINDSYDVIVIGGGQAGLSLGFYLRRSKLKYLILDAQNNASGAWQHGWKSLKLFSPAQWSSLPGWLMPGGGTDKYPTRDEVLDYLEKYEERYQLPLKRPVLVTAVKSAGDDLIVETTKESFVTKTVVCATGSWNKPFIPLYPGQSKFQGKQIHSGFYQSAEAFAGQRVLIIGGGNSGAQIMAEVSGLAEATWITLEEPQFLPDEVDGRVLFDVASEKYRALTSSNLKAETPKANDLLGSIVMVEPVKKARDHGLLKSQRPFTSFTPQGVVWSDGREESIDTVIWCTGFKPALDFLEPLNILTTDGKAQVKGTHSISEQRLWLVGYGNWTGFASATLIGVGRSARSTVEEITDFLSQTKQ